jgi:hypothetical protein
LVVERAAHNTITSVTDVLDKLSFHNLFFGQPFSLRLYFLFSEPVEE